MDSSGIHLWLVLMKAYRTLERHARCSIEPLGLGSSDFAILELLLHRGRQPVNAIGRRVDLTSGAIIDLRISNAMVRHERAGADCT